MLAAMWRWAVVLGLAQVVAMGQQKVPFVGCPGDGQVGPIKPPKTIPMSFDLPPSAAKQLAYYRANGGYGVLGPRGWHCFELYGSGGSVLFITPRRFPPEQWLSATFDGPGIEVDVPDSVSGSGGSVVAMRLLRYFSKSHPELIERQRELYPLGDFPMNEPSIP